jgi:hypothetical protein
MAAYGPPGRSAASIRSYSAAAHRDVRVGRRWGTDVHQVRLLDRQHRRDGDVSRRDPVLLLEVHQPLGVGINRGDDIDPVGDRAQCRYVAHFGDPAAADHRDPESFPPVHRTP